ncbi:uncharacterized protein LOC115213516 [Argonauta hians]
MEFRAFAAVLLLAVSVAYSQDIMSLCQNMDIRPGSSYVRSPNNCSEFFWCNAMFPHPLACGKDTVFSQSQQVCVARNSQYDDCDRVIYGGKFNDPLCRPRPFGVNRDPRDCHRYIPCYNMTSYPSMACQSGLFFSFSMQRCTTEDKADCRQ